MQPKTPEFPPGFPIVIGISGHRSIEPSALETVRGSLEQAFKDIRARLGNHLYVATGLAEGADQCAAELAVELGIPHIAVLPMSLAEHEATMSTPQARQALHKLWRASELRLELPKLEPATGESAADLEKLQYEQLASVLSRFSHLLIVLWDGEEWPGDDPAGQQALRGGTSHLVEMNRRGERIAAGFRRSKLFHAANSALDLAGGGPVLHIATPRAGQPLPSGSIGAWSLLDSPSLRKHEAILTEVLGSEDEEADASRSAEFFAEILHLNERERQFDRRELEIRNAQLSDPEFESAGLADAELEFLRQRQATADTAAQHYQRILLGDAPTTAGLLERIRHLWGFRAQHHRRPLLGVVVGYAGLLMASVFCFELFAHLLQHTLWLLVLQLGILGGMYRHHRRWVRGHKWQNRFQDYRAIAEAMRVQVFWALGGIPSAVSDHYMRKQSDEMGWISFVLRGPALWSIAVAARHLKHPQRDLIDRAWLCDQQGYFLGVDGKPGKAAQNHDAQKANQRARDVLFGLALLLTFVLVLPLALQAWQGVGGGVPHCLDSGALWLKKTEVHEVFVTVIVLLLALGATVHFVTEKFAYEAHALSYTAMGKLFSKALAEARSRECRKDDATYQLLLLELGREALAENSDWLDEHRRREVAPEPPG